ncbi:Serine proteases trypsin domain [Trinorchestia longiramus]|nr:Serine proteases trypsin domain [Trinorchestia longiramus]
MKEVIKYRTFNQAYISENSWTEQLFEAFTITKDVKHPWQLFMFTEQRSSSVGACGAVLLSSDWAVTTARCTLPATSVTLLGGGTDWVSMMLGDEGVQVTVDERIIHPQYDSFHDPPLHNIALLKLNKTIQLTPNLKPAKLPPLVIRHMDLTGKTVTVTGWGASKGNSKLMSSSLQSARLTVLNEKQCTAIYGESLRKAEVFCAKGKYFSAAGICKGDSGGAVTYTQAGKTYLVGVAEFRDSSCSADAPTGALDITYYLRWIKRVTGLH